MNLFKHTVARKIVAIVGPGEDPAGDWLDDVSDWITSGRQGALPQPPKGVSQDWVKKVVEDATKRERG